jgi:HlyD family secretion protein
VASPTRTTITEAIASAGRVGGVIETSVGVQAAGVVARLFVREGDRVAAGQHLARLKNDVAEGRVAQAEAVRTTARAALIQVARGALPSDLEAAAAQVRQARAQLEQQRAACLQGEQAVAQARSQLNQLQAERELAVRQLARSERLLERGLIAQAEHDEAVTRGRVADERLAAQQQGIAVAEAAVRAAQSGIAAAEANLAVQEARHRTLQAGARAEDVAIARERVREAEEALQVARQQAGEALVVAPFEGIVTAIHAEVGQTVGAQGVLRLVSRALEIRIDVDESNLADLALGQSAVVSSTAFPDTPFPGTVREIAAAVDEARGTVTVTLVPDATPDWLRPGQTVNVNVITNRAAERLLVPPAAVRRAGDQTVVLVVQDGRAVERLVLTRPPTTAGIPVVSGLTAEDRVIASPAGVRPGDRVRAGK